VNLFLEHFLLLTHLLKDFIILYYTFSFSLKLVNSESLSLFISLYRDGNGYPLGRVQTHTQQCGYLSAYHKYFWRVPIRPGSNYHPYPYTNVFLFLLPLFPQHLNFSASPIFLFLFLVPDSNTFTKLNFLFPASVNRNNIKYEYDIKIK